MGRKGLWKKGHGGKDKGNGKGYNRSTYEVRVMGGQWNEEWGIDEWNYGTEVDTDYARSFATLAPAKPVVIKNRYEAPYDATDHTFVVTIAEFIREPTRKS